MLNKRTTHQLAGNGEPLKVLGLCKVHKSKADLLGAGGMPDCLQFPISIFFLGLTEGEKKEMGWKQFSQKLFR